MPMQRKQACGCCCWQLAGIVCCKSDVSGPAATPALRCADRWLGLACSIFPQLRPGCRLLLLGLGRLAAGGRPRPAACAHVQPGQGRRQHVRHCQMLQRICSCPRQVRLHARFLAQISFILALDEYSPLRVQAGSKG